MTYPWNSLGYLRGMFSFRRGDKILGGGTALSPTSTNPGVTLAWWIYHEAVRREGLAADEFCRNYVLSYPRSGNHATRFALEYLSGQPTLGADDHESLLRPGSPYDLPIFLRSEHVRISIPLPPPVAIKRHRLKPNDRVEKLVLIERDPVEAVLSHTNRGDKATKEDLEAGVSWWKSLQEQFEKHPKDQRHLVRYENITNNDTEWIKALAVFLHIKTKDEVIQQCGELLGEARKVLTRSPLTKHPHTYREMFPEKATVVERFVTAQGLVRLS